MFQEEGVHVTDRIEEPREQKVNIGWLPGLLGKKRTIAPNFGPEKGHNGF